MPLAIAFVGRSPAGAGGAAGGRGFPTLRTAVATAAAAGAAVFAWQAPTLPLDNLATRLRPGREVAELCAGGAGSGSQRVCLTTIVPELAHGRHLVVMADLQDPAFTADIDRLNDYARDARDGKAPPLWVLSGGTAEEQRRFFWTWGPAFEIREAPPALLKPLYRRLPRSFLVEDGEVHATYSGLPPLARLGGGGAVASKSVP